MNGSVSAVSFAAYDSLALYNSALVVLIAVLYISALCVSLFLILVIYLDSHLHRPMYIFLVHLVLSGMVGSSSVCPTLIFFLLDSRRQTSLQACLAQVFFTTVYGGCVFCILALMAFDRYVSICKPLQYHAIITPAKVKLMLVLLYLTLTCFSAVQVYLTSRLQLCRHTLNKLLCDSLAIANLSCEVRRVISVYGLCCAICFLILPSLLVILSYLHIFTVILKTSKATRRRALHTCTPHLVTFISFCAASFFGVIYNRVSDSIPAAVTLLTCVNFFISPSLLHPIIYGIKMKEIRQSVTKLMLACSSPASRPHTKPDVFCVKSHF